MYFDTHVHTSFSSDSKMNIKEAIKKAKRLGLGLITTEHLDYEYPDENLFRVDISSYIQAYSQYRSENYFIGLEMGLSESCYNENVETAENYSKLDYIIGSIHAVEGKDIYAELFAFEKDKKQCYEKYLKTMLSNIKLYDCFHSLGHIDYICRYAPFEDKELYYNDFSDYFDEIFKALLKKDKVLELNTRRLGDKAAFENMVTIYSRYKELGGKYVTVGSDAHTPESIGINFEQAKLLIEKLSLKPVYFLKGKMEYL